MARGCDPGLAARWEQRLRRFEQCRQTVTRFCCEEGVSEAAFYAWRKKLRQASISERGAARGVPSSPAFVPLQMAVQGPAFDVVCALETFEHDPHAEKTIARMLEFLRPEGLFFMTCAGEGRREHGTRRTGNCYGPDPNFYRNVSVAEFLKVESRSLSLHRVIHSAQRESSRPLLLCH